MKNKVLKINIFMFILFFIMLLTLGIDYLTYFFNTNYLLSLSISLVFNLILFHFIKKKIEITKDFHKLDLIFFGVLFIIFIISIVFPDRTFDTFNYHLYLQEHPFGDKIGFDFFAGKNLNSFSFAFPDRMFYLFRYFLGYRLGVILNYLIIITIYYQVKSILKHLLKNSKELTIVIISVLISTSLSLIDIVDSYYIDLISLVLLLEIFRLVLVERINDKNNRVLLGYFSILFGLSVVVKISNAFSLIVLFLVYVIRNRNIKKYINIKNILIVLSLLLLPLGIYVVYNYMETGNPVFPFYNTIFKSKYFGEWNWLDTRFGPQRFLDKFLYPLTMAFKPKMACDIGIIEPIWSTGYFISIFYIVYYTFKKFIKKTSVNKDKLLLAITTFLIYLVWFNFQLGYTRYGFISLVLGSICTYIFIVDMFKKNKFVIVIIMSLFITYNYYYYITNYTSFNQNWIYNNIFNNGLKTYMYNFKNIFATGNETKIEFEEGSVWGIIYNNSGYAMMHNSDIPIINLNDSANGDYAKKELEKRLSNVSHIYTLVDSLDLDNFIKRLEEAGYRIKGVKDVVTSKIIGTKNSFTYIFEIEKNDEYKTEVTSNDSLKEFDISNIDSISFYIGIDRWTNGAYGEDPKLIIYGDNKENIIKEISLDKNGSLDKIDLDVSNYNKIILESNNTWFMIIKDKKR